MLAPALTDAEQGTGSLLSADPELEEAIPAADRPQAARALTTRIEELARGAWSPDDLVGSSQRPWGLVVLDGVIIREVLLAGRANAELFGPGDVLYPWERDNSALSCSVRWLSAGATVALLDERFLVAARRWPALLGVIHGRVVEQLGRSARRSAVLGLPRVEERLLGLFWQLADRFGVVTPEGVLIRLPLTHSLIGELIAARRPTVSLALNLLAEQGLLRRDRDGSWMLAHESLRELGERGAGKELPSMEAGLA